jgi:hypothetical protein
MSESPAPTRRWTARRKAEVLIAVRSGKITIEQALCRYQLTEEEFLAWQYAFDQYGIAGLRATRLQRFGGRRAATNSAE